MNTSNFVADKYKRLEIREHVRLRPEIYVGSKVFEIRNCFVAEYIDDNIKIVKKDIDISPLLERIFLEILSNATDNIYKSKLQNVPVTKIIVTMDDDTISIWNDGRHIITNFNEEEKMYDPQMIFGEYMTGSNFDDTQERKWGGKNGEGAKLTNTFSTKFDIEIGDPTNNVVYKQVWINSMSNVSEPDITKKLNVKPYTKVTYTIDKEYLGIQKYTDDIKALFLKYCIDSSVTTKIPVLFNNIKINMKNIQDFAKLFEQIKILPKNFLKYTDDDTDMIIYDTPDQGFVQSFVNSIITMNGGVHVEIFIDKIYDIVKKKFNVNRKILVRKKDIFPHLTIFVMTRVANPDFDSQSKLELKKPKPIINHRIISYDSVMKWNMVVYLENIVNAKNIAKMSKGDGKRTKHEILKVSHAAKAGTKYSYKCSLYLTEGDSAATFAIKGIKYLPGGRNFNGVYPLKGKLLNVRKATKKQILNNVELDDIRKILGLKHNVDYSISENRHKLNYGKVIFLVDADTDGSHIKGLGINFFGMNTELINYVELLKNNYVSCMLTPIVRSKKGRKIKVFYTLKEFNDWLKLDGNSGWKHGYFKGLGGSSDKEIEECFKHPKFLTYKYDDNAKEKLSLVFGKGRENDRKQWLMNYDENNLQPISPNISNFIDNEMIVFSNADLIRSIPSIWDGFKPSQRKVLYSLRKKKPKTPIEVSRFGAGTAELTKYHHGEKSMFDTIINMAQNFPGSNNLPFINIHSQFGSRFGSVKRKNKQESAYGIGTDHAAPRYIKISYPNILKYVFREEDDVLLEYLEDGGNKIEPKYFYPIIPSWAINGSHGIGTGWSTTIQNYNPIQIIQFIKCWLENEDSVPSLLPYYKGYQGKIYYDGLNIVNEGTFRITKIDEITVTSTPVNKSYKQYETELIKMKKANNIIDYEEKCDANSACFIIKGFRGKLTAKNLKLSTTLPTSNYTLFDGNNKPRKFYKINTLLNYYCTIRLQKYKERKTKFVQALKFQLTKLQLKIKFIELVMDDKLIIQKREEKDVLKDMKKYGFPKEFLLIAILSFTKGKLNKSKNDIVLIKLRLNYYNETSACDLWLSDLDELEDQI